MSIYNVMRNELRLDVSRNIQIGVNLYKGTNYKKSIPLLELVDSKIYKFDDRFVRYVSMSDTIKDNLEGRYPYLNLEHFNLQWTANELINECLRQHDEFFHKTQRIEKEKMSVPERLKNVTDIYS